MPTFLFDKIIFGPVKSRRLGVSLGINLLPVDSKLCSFDCIYCECGLNTGYENKKVSLPTRKGVAGELSKKLSGMVEKNMPPDVITFAGNGEPTLHPEFNGIIDDTIELRNKYCPDARIAVLSNASRLDNKNVFNALLKVDDNIQKLDSGLKETILTLDRPNYRFDLNKTVEQLKNFNGKVTIQTMFVKGMFDEKIIDNTTQEDIEAWLKLLEYIKPGSVMIYTIERDTPFDSLHKVSLDELNKIAQKAESKGFKTLVSG
ncbi:MAG: radical SAM protein [Chlorobi bacterium]|nr:radical SAM protein [Chlorobiota bacterium]